jgi:hypothetical protein
LSVGAFAGSTGAPFDSGYTKIYSTRGAFAALKADGSIKAWGGSESGGKDAPTNKGYIKIYSSDSASISVAIHCIASNNGDGVCVYAPTNKGYIKIYSSDSAFAALKADGSITSWGNLDNCHPLHNQQQR